MENNPKGRRASQHVAENVRRLRLDRGWSLAHVSETLTGSGYPLSLPVLSKIERGDRGIDVDDLWAFAHLFEVTPSQLMADPVTAKHNELVELLERWIEAMARQREMARRAQEPVKVAEHDLRQAVGGSEEARRMLQEMLEERFPESSHWPKDLVEILIDEGED